MKIINNNNFKLQMINSVGNYVFKIISFRKEKIEFMKKK